MLVIENLKWTHENFTHLVDLNNLFVEKIKSQMGLKINSVVETNNRISFKEVESNKLVLSIKPNKILMKAGDPRIKKLGRDYLETKRVTEKQYNGFFEAIHSTLDDLGLSADIKLNMKDKTYTIREGKNKNFTLPEVNSFPKEQG